jgi:hypothetical protein
MVVNVVVVEVRWEFGEVERVRRWDRVTVSRGRGVVERGVA